MEIEKRLLPMLESALPLFEPLWRTLMFVAPNSEHIRQCAQKAGLRVIATKGNNSSDSQRYNPMLGSANPKEGSAKPNPTVSKSRCNNAKPPGTSGSPRQSKPKKKVTISKPVPTKPSLVPRK